MFPAPDLEGRWACSKHHTGWRAPYSLNTVHHRETVISVLPRPEIVYSELHFQEKQKNIK